MADHASDATFTGFPSQTFRWFAGLEADNSKRYFTEHRSTFDEFVGGALESMLDELAERLGGGEVKVFRQHRDLRFSPDKSPYKTRTYGVIGDRPGAKAALYAEIAASGLFAGTGMYRPAPEQLSRLREAVADDASGPALEAAVAHAEAAGLEVIGATLKTAPRGFPRDHPRVRLLRHTSVVAGSRLGPSRAGIGRERALAHATDTWAACEPLNAWLERYVGPAQNPRPGPPARTG